MAELRVVALDVHPLPEGAVGSWAEFRAEDGGRAASPVASAVFQRFERALDGPLELELGAGEVVVLGPPVDLLRCRALPGERELRALRAESAGVLRLAPGVWFSGGRARRSPDAVALDARDYGEIFAMRFALAVPEG